MLVASLIPASPCPWAKTDAVTNTHSIGRRILLVIVESFKVKHLVEFEREYIEEAQAVIQTFHQMSSNVNKSPGEIFYPILKIPYQIDYADRFLGLPIHFIPCFSKTFRCRDDIINLLVPEKQIVAIVGPSGGGKTTLLRMLAGLETIDSGQIVYNGENLPLDALEKRNLLGFVFQDFQLFPHLSVMENLILSPIKTMNVTKEEASKKAMSLLERLGLEQHADAYPFSLSGGQKQRVALARAMMIDPEIIGYDEPTSALDPELRLEVEKLILQNRELGMTQIVVTHDIPFAEAIADVLLKVEPK